MAYAESTNEYPFALPSKPKIKLGMTTEESAC
jgi:hypothetical protein